MRNKPSVQTALLGALLLHLRSQRANSRSSLSAVTGLSPSTVGLYVDILLSGGYIAESGLEKGMLGRPKRTLGLLANAGWFAGIEFNAERLRAVGIDFAGVQQQELVSHFLPKVDKASVIAEIKKAVSTLAKNADGPLCSIGIGAPGIVDPMKGNAIHYAFIPDWKNVSLVATIERRFRVPVILENNLRAIALAERWFGGGRELDEYVVLGPRSGFGMAIVKDGRLMSGVHHAAGEIGNWHWPVDGKQGELHNALASPAVWRRLNGLSAKGRLPPDLYVALSKFANESGPVWRAIVDEYATLLSHLQLVLDSHTYFLHGPLTALGARFCQAIVDRIAVVTPLLQQSPLKLVPSTLGDDAGALGAASLAMEAWLPRR
ncbi:MAG: ROK family protein [Pirellulaceae bacterium]|nr:ROK family protein [Pirellulaceae bacterium]